MIDAFERIVLDDAEPHQLLGATKLSDLAKANLEECLAAALAGLEEAHDELGTSDAQRALDRAKVRAVVTAACARSIEKIKLRLEGRHPSH